MNTPQGLECPRCRSAVSENSEYCERCRFRFRLSNASLRQAAHGADAIYRQSATRQLERLQSPTGLQIWAIVVALLALLCLVSGFDALVRDAKESVCLPPRSKICAIAYAFGGAQHLNLAYGIINCMFAIGFVCIAWTLNIKSARLRASAIAKENAQKIKD